MEQSEGIEDTESQIVRNGDGIIRGDSRSPSMASCDSPWASGWLCGPPAGETRIARSIRSGYLCQFDRDEASHRVAQQVRLFHADDVEVISQSVCELSNRQRALRFVTSSVAG